MRNLFIALDRKDVQFASKEISKAMAQPTVNTDDTLKGNRQVPPHSAEAAVVHPGQPHAFQLSDANWAACLVTRKNSGCTHLMLVRHPIFAGITTAALMLDLGFKHAN